MLGTRAVLFLLSAKKSLFFSQSVDEGRGRLMSTSNGHSNDDDDDDVVTVNGAGDAKDVAINGATSGKPSTSIFVQI